jgi:hypothetical protein
MMNDEKEYSKDDLYISVLKKLYGAWDAGKYFAESCEVCSETLVPVDAGVDPYTDTRLWLTKCCGIVQRYDQKLGPERLKASQQDTSDMLTNFPLL